MVGRPELVWLGQALILRVFDTLKACTGRDEGP